MFWIVFFVKPVKPGLQKIGGSWEVVSWEVIKYQYIYIYGRSWFFILKAPTCAGKKSTTESLLRPHRPAVLSPNVQWPHPSNLVLSKPWCQLSWWQSQGQKDVNQQKHLLVGGWTNSFEKYWSKWESSLNRGEHKESVKPPPSLSTLLASLRNIFQELTCSKRIYKEFYLFQTINFGPSVIKFRGVTTKS